MWKLTGDSSITETNDNFLSKDKVVNRYIYGLKTWWFVVSVTEEEVYNGILAVDNADTACYWFKRTLAGLNENTGHKPAYLYMDMANGKPDEEALNLLTKLK